MNLHICGCLKPIVHKICGIIQPRVYQKKVQDVSDLRQHLIYMRVRVQQSVIDDDILTSGAEFSIPALEPQEDI